MLKKISAVTLSFLLAAVTLVSCGNSSSSEAESGTSSSAADSSTADSTAGDSSSADDSSAAEEPQVLEPSLTIDGEKVDTKDLVLLTIDGTDIDFDTFRYYYYYVLSVYGLTPDGVTEENFEDILNNTVRQIKQEFVSLKLAKENDITLDDDDMKKIEEDIANVKGNYESEEAYQDGLKSFYLTDDVLQFMEELNATYQKVYDTLLTNGGKYATTLKEFKKVVKDNEKYARAKHILISYASQAELDEETAKTFDSMSLAEKSQAKSAAYAALDEDAQKECQEKAKKVAEEVLQKVKDGEDFDKLIKEYGWDPGMENDKYKDGYYVRPDSSFIQEFKDEAFRLKENETSTELIESSAYGYFILKRLPVDMDYVEEHFDTLVQEYDSPRIQELYSDLTEELKVEESDTYKKLAYNSIT
ncbi:MAG: peptidylprolyl isomerase [Ruminococcus sp.]|nr:peptidylprolyl isomerase [Ruminococcus sp.]